MTYKSVLRSVGSAIRKAERESIRHQKELSKRNAAYEKMQALEKDAYDVEVYENYIDRITSLHKDCISEYNWLDISKQKVPLEPEKITTREFYSRSKLNNFQSNFFDKLFKLDIKKRQKLEDELLKSIQEDKLEYEKTQEIYKNELKDYNELMVIANGILQGNTNIYKQAVEEFEPLSEISDLGSQLNFDFISNDKMKIYMFVHDTKIIPKESKSLLKSGKLTIKDLPIAKFNELYQDYVCSSLLRIAREMFGLLPVDDIIVTAKSKLLNTSNGKLEDQPILSVRFIRETINSIDFENIDPSDSMINFVHNMGFKKNQGMSVVEEVSFA